MERDLRQVGLDLRRVRALEREGGFAMALHPSRCGQVVVERVANQDVCEPKAVRSAGDFSDDALRHRFVESVVQRLLRKLAQVLENVDAELPPENRRGRKELPCRLGESRDTAS